MTENELQQLTAEIIKELKNDGESEYIERKISDSRFFGEYVSALSNGACLRNEEFGYLVFGVNDKNRKVEGTSVKRSDLERINIKRLLEPKVSYWIYSFYVDSEPIILVKISAAKGEPTFYEGQAYARVGEDKTSLKNLSSEQIRKIYNSTIDWSSITSDNAKIDDLDELALKKAREKFKEKRENSSYLKDIDEILINQLPGFLSAEAKKKKIENLLQEMSKKDQTIKNYGNAKSPKWKKLGEN